MSHEIEQRVLGALMQIGDPNNVIVQESMLKLTNACFCNREATQLFDLIQHAFKCKQHFDYSHLESYVPTELHEYFATIISSYYTSNMLLQDVETLNHEQKARNIGAKFKDVNHSFTREPIAKEACQIAVAGCIAISKMASIEEEHVYTAERLADMFLSDEGAEDEIIPTGIKSIDNINDGGFKVKSLITIAGRSGMGKTCFATHLAHSLASNHKRKHVLFYSLEMSAISIYSKQISTIAGKQAKKLNITERLLAVAVSMDFPFTVDSKQDASIDYIETTARIVALSKPVSVIVVDYLNIVSNKATFESHALRQSDISKRLAALAAELNCIVIALSQVNRDYSGRPDKCPITSDAADSSGSERSSTYWLGIHRPEVDDECDKSVKNQFIVKCRKNRWGAPWSVVFAFNEATFGEVDQHLFHQKKPEQKKKGFEKYMQEKENEQTIPYSD